MSLYEEDAVHQVISTLTQLQFLNGIEIHRRDINGNSRSKLENDSVTK